MTPVQFLQELWTDTPPGWMLLWELSSKQSRYIQSPTAATVLNPNPIDLYTGVGLAHKDHGRRNRTSNEMVCAIPGLWADIDVGKPGQGCQTLADAVELANVIAGPTLLVNSGHGLHAWWLFDEPWRFTTRSEQRLAARAAAQWQKLLRDHLGGGLDHTHDLARVLRLPGTRNGKDPNDVRPVEVWDQGARFERDDLIEMAARAGDVDPGYRIGEAVIAAGGICPTAGAAGRLCRDSPTFRVTWAHEREMPSMSEYDMALGSIAALAGCSDNEIAGVIVEHRRNHNDPKGDRLDYLARTVAKIRAGKAVPAAPDVSRSGTYIGERWADVIRKQLKARHDQSTIPLPFEVINEGLDGGLRPGDVCVVAGYTSHGKTVLVDQMADTAAAAAKRGHLYLTEMTAYERGLRLLARRAHIDFKKLRRRDLDAKDWLIIESTLSLLPYGVSIVSDWSVEDVMAHIIENRWDFAVVDLIHGFHYNDERELSKTSSAIVRAAKASATDEHPGTAIVVAAHLNDGQMRDQRSPARPMPGLHSIKGSSSLKQDADVVMFVWQHDDDQGRPTGLGKIWTAKVRQGSLASVDVRLDTASMTFKEQFAAARGAA